MIFYPISALLNAITSTILCVIVITRNPKSHLNRSFAYFAASVALWSYFYFLWQISKSSEAALLWCRVLMAFAIFIPTAFLHFSVTLIGQSKKYLKTIIFWYLVSFVFLLSDFTPLFVKEIKPQLSFPFWPMAGIAYGPFLAMFIGLTVYAHILMYKSYRRLSGFEKNQIKYVFLGTSIGFIGGTTNYPLWYGVPIPPVGNALVAVYVFTVAYSIIKYRLMDIRIAIARMAILLTTYGIIFSVPIVLLTVFKAELVQIMGDKWWLIPAVIYTVATIIAPFIYQKLQSRAADRILREQRHNHTVITTAAKGITLVRDLDKLLSITVRILTRTLRITYATVYLLDKSTRQYSFYVTRSGKKDEVKIDTGNSLIKYLQGVRKPIVYEEVKRLYEDRRDVFIREIRDTMNRLGADLLVPSYIESELIGFLVLGPKKTGEVYSIEDLDVLSNLANQSALAIENAQFLKEREEMQAKLRQAETFEVIRDMLGSLGHEMFNLVTQAAPTLELISMGSYDNKPLEKLKEDAKKAREKLMFQKTILGWVREYYEKSCAGKISGHNALDMINNALSYADSKNMIEKEKIKTTVSVDSKIFIIGVETLPLIFKQLVINSVFGYGMEDGGELTITARLLDGSNTVEIVQTDTGHDLSKYMQDNSTCGGATFAEKGKIGGISYYIAKAVIVQHKGSLEVMPNDVRGTKFIIRLPLDFNRVTA